MSVVLDKDVILSEASIWQRQCDFYAREGVTAWYNQVPFYATSNAFIARAYADMIKNFMDDWHAQHGGQQFYILELGAGCGQFSYLCLQSLHTHSAAVDYKWHYLMSDFDNKLLSFWRDHPGFKPFLDTGCLSVLQLTIGDDIKSLFEPLVTTDTPLIVIANYLFDSLPADIYRVCNEELFPVKVTLTTTRDNLNDQNAVIDFEQVAMACNVVEQPMITENVLLQQYRTELLDSYLLYPQVGIKLLDQLRNLLPQGFLLLATDKAYGNSEELDYLEAPELTGHNGCFSIMVNFDALARYAKLYKGEACITSTRAGIKTAAISVGFSLENFNYLDSVMQQHIQRFAPTDYLNFYRNMQKKIATFNLEEAISMLALSNWDSIVFQRLYKLILEQLDGADMLTINYLLEHLPTIASHYYWLEQTEDVLFQIAIIFHTLKMYSQALKYYEQSLVYFPGIFGLYFNMGVCHYHLGQIFWARQCFEQAQQLDPADKKTQEWLSRLN